MLYVYLLQKLVNLISIILSFYKNLNNTLKNHFTHFYLKQDVIEFFYFFFSFGSTIYSSLLKSIDLDFFIIFSFYLKLKLFFSKKKILKFFFYQKKSNLFDFLLLKNINFSKMLINFELNQVSVDLQYFRISHHLSLLKKVVIDKNNWEFLIDKINLKKKQKLNSVRSTLKMQKMIPNFFIFKNLINNFKDITTISKNYKSIFGFINGITMFIIICKMCRYYPFSCTIFLYYYVIKYIFQKNITSFFFLKYKNYPNNIKNLYLKTYSKKLKAFKCFTPTRNFFLTSYNLSLQQVSVFILLFINSLQYVLFDIKNQNFITNSFFSLNNTFLKISFIIKYFSDHNNKFYIKKIKKFLKFLNITNKFIFNKSFSQLIIKNKKMDMIESYSIINCTKDNNKKNLIGQIYFIELQNITSKKKYFSTKVYVNAKLVKWGEIFSQIPKQTLL